MSERESNQVPKPQPLGPYRVRVAPCTRGERAELLALAAERIPEPLALFRERLGLLDDPEARRLLVERYTEEVHAEQRQWPPAWGSWALTAFVAAPENLPAVLAIALHGPNGDALSAEVTAHAEAALAGFGRIPEARAFASEAWAILIRWAGAKAPAAA